MGRLRATARSVAALLIVSFAAVAGAGNTLEVGKGLKDNETLISSEGAFALGFFTGRLDRRYLGIWYNRIPGRTVVWVANRERPVAGAAGELTLSGNGTLVLADAAGTVYWSSAALAAAPRAPVARLLDNGNLVVTDGSSEVYAWESFSQPTDTLLPDMKLGVNANTGRTFNLRPWRSADDPAPGDFSVEIADARGIPQLVITKGSVTVWRGGPWTGNRFSGIPSMKANNQFTYAFYWESGEFYFKLNSWSSSAATRVTVNRLGIAEHFFRTEDNPRWDVVWTSAMDECDGYNVCGANGLCDMRNSPACGCPEGFTPRRPPAVGCDRKEPLQCRSGTGGFVEVASAKLPDTTAATVDKTIGFDECKARCLRNCSCTAFTSSDGTGCMTWFGDLDDVRVYNATEGHELLLRVAASQGGERRMTKAMTAVIACLAVVIVLLAALWWFIRRRARRLTLPVKIESCSNYDTERAKEFDLPMFHLHSIVAATKNFSFQNKLGEGGFGPVYQGNLSDGQSIAAKRLSTNSGQGLEEFKSEIKLLANLQHTNLVKLLGCCIDGEEKILIYEYMANQSLDKFIFDPRRRAELDWPKRANIIEGIAQGLLYLHRYSRVRVIHRDLKASNILLDGEWNPKISDFGLARIFSWNDDPANTKHIVGTYGYISPEYAMKGHFSVKSDVFSYGILVLEILSGKRNTSTPDLDEALNLSGHAWKLWRSDSVMELMDPALAGTCSAVEFSRCVHVALLCVQENPADRPNMLDVVSMLNNESSNMLAPNRPAYLLERLVMREDGEPVKCRVNSSTNEITHSEMRAR